MKKIILEHDHIMDIRYELEGDINDVIENLKKIKSNYEDKYIDLRIDIDVENDYYNNPYISVSLIGSRKETDEEYNKRLVKEVKAKELSESQEIALAKKLMKKYNLG